MGTREDVKRVRKERDLFKKRNGLMDPPAAASGFSVPLSTGVAGGVCAVHGAAEAAEGAPGEYHS